LNLRCQVYHLLTPLLREAKETVNESLCKNAEGGPSIFFARRGTFVAHGDLPDNQFYEIDASVHPGVLFGEHALTATERCLCNYRAKTRCELFAMGVDDLYRLAAGLAPRHRDEMAELIYTLDAERKAARAEALRALVMATTALPSRSNDDRHLRELMAALRMQAVWALRLSKRASAAERDAAMLAAALPALYMKAFRRGEEELAPPKTVDEKLESMEARMGKLEEKIDTLPTKEDLAAAVAKAVREAMGMAQATSVEG
jgi:CRP-like cAMP-binding protein